MEQDLKQKQIEERDKLVKELAKDIGIAFQISQTTKFTEIADILVDKWQPKIPKDSVVLSMEEQDKLYSKGFNDGKEFAEKFYKPLVRAETRKETAEKFALKLSDYFVEHCGGRLSISLTLQEWYKMIDEICKEIMGDYKSENGNKSEININDKE